MTVGLEKARRRVRRREPRTQAVWAVKVGKVRALSMAEISSRARGGRGMVGSVDMILVVVVVVDLFLVRCRGVGGMVVEYILSCWVSEEARVSRILSLGTLRIRVDLLYISSATHGGILITYLTYV